MLDLEREREDAEESYEFEESFSFFNDLWLTKHVMALGQRVEKMLQAVGLVEVDGELVDDEGYETSLLEDEHAKGQIGQAEADGSAGTGGWCTGTGTDTNRGKCYDNSTRDRWFDAPTGPAPNSEESGGWQIDYSAVVWPKTQAHVDAEVREDLEHLIAENEYAVEKHYNKNASALGHGHGLHLHTHTDKASGNSFTSAYSHNGNSNITTLYSSHARATLRFLYSFLRFHLGRALDNQGGEHPMHIVKIPKWPLHNATDVVSGKELFPLQKERRGKM